METLVSDGERDYSYEELVALPYESEDEEDVVLIRHLHKYAFVHNLVYHDGYEGGLYYVSMHGSAQMCRGIMAALVSKNNKNSATLESYSGDRFSQKSALVIAPNAVGTMKMKGLSLAGRVREFVLVSKLLAWDYDYAEQRKKMKDEEEKLTPEEGLKMRKALCRFVLMADDDESEYDIAQRWIRYVALRWRDAFHMDWAYTLWEYCSETRARGVRPLTALKGRAWLCEPEQSVMRDAVRELGVRGLLERPPELYGVAPPPPAEIDPEVLALMGKSKDVDVEIPESDMAEGSSFGDDGEV